MSAQATLRWLSCVVAGLLGLAAAGLAPEPDPIPRRWQLNVSPGPLRVMTVDDGGGARQYLYFTYKVVNATGQDQLFAPSFELSSDASLVQRSGRDVPAAVTRAILDSLGNPLLKDQISIVGPLLQGEANAEEGLVVWPVQSGRMSEISIYGAGFSGETRAIEVKNPSTGATDRIMLRKTLVMRYQMPGEIVDRGSEPFPLAESPRWVLR